MADKNIYLYQTQSLYNRMYNERHAQRALNRAKTYIKGAFSRINLTIDIEIRSKTPNPPQEYYKDVSGPVPCGSISSDWSWLNGWFRDWLACKSLQPGHDEFDDVSVLLSNTDETSGGLAFARCMHAQTGYWVSQLPSSYQKAGNGKAHAAMSTVLHELGHAFMENTDPKYEHNVGKTDRTSSSSTKYQTTPMGVIKGKDENECGVPHYYDKGTDTGADDVLFRHIWSSCCLDEWSPYAYQK
ncbi:hypothetical protein [Halobaculum sp. MBLA0143]|uniref:hypothetical protein n=1 Tax=Halobaculum sp. MBLA0143 TaxID=3079933 RepID=UPI003523EF03